MRQHRRLARRLANQTFYQLNPNETQLKNFPGTGTAVAGRNQLAAAGISPGVMKPLDVLVEHGGNAQQVAARLRTVPGVVGATAPSAWQRGSNSLVEAFPAIDGSAPGIQGVVDRVNGTLKGTDGKLNAISATPTTAALPILVSTEGQVCAVDDQSCEVAPAAQ